MSVTFLGVVVVGLALIGWLFSERLFIVMLAASAAITTSAAVNIGENSVSPFHIIGAMALVSALISRVRGRKVGHPAAALLIVLVGVALLVTAIAPTLFSGLPILSPRGGIDRQVFTPTPLAYTPSMAAQLAYLVAGVGAAFYLAQRRTLAPALVTIPIFLGTTLSALRMIPAFAAPVDWVFRNSLSAGYNEYEQRPFGIYSEPSYLGVFSLMALAYALYRFRDARGIERGAVVLIAVLSVINLVVSESGTGALGLILLLGIAVCYYGGRFLFFGMRLHPALLLAPFAIAVAILLPNPLTRALTDAVEGKSVTDSFRNRTASDLFSIELTGQTYGFGVGLGASRPSSFATLVLSNLGIIGFLLLAAAIVVILRRIRRSPEWTAAGVALFALVLTKVIAEPALSTPILWFLIGVCMYAGRAVDDHPFSSSIERTAQPSGAPSGRPVRPSGPNPRPAEVST